MSIQEILDTCKPSSWLRGDVAILVIVVFVAISSFYLGRFSVEPPLKSGSKAGLSGTQSTTVFEARATPSQIAVSEDQPLKPPGLEGSYVASKSGTKYHLPWCPGASQMKEENKIWFDTKEEAEVAGYSPAANCKGI